MIYKASESGANIICTQELFKTTYFCQTEDYRYFEYAETINKEAETIKTFSKIAEETGSVLILSLFEKRADGLYHNSAVVIDADGSYLGKYRKMHIPDDPHFLEKFYFTPGDLGFKVFNTKYGKIGILICWDQWFPEAARLTAMKGADIIFYPTAIGRLSDESESEEKTYIESWKNIQISHAVANGCYVASVNRVGFEPSPDGNGGIHFWGNSFVCDPLGKIIKNAPKDSEHVLITEIDLKLIEKTRTVWPFFRDRRIDAYGDLSKRWLEDL